MIRKLWGGEEQLIDPCLCGCEDLEFNWNVSFGYMIKCPECRKIDGSGTWNREYGFASRNASKTVIAWNEYMRAHRAGDWESDRIMDYIGE